MSYRLFLDSGAPSIYHRYARKKDNNAVYMGSFLKDRKNDSFDWLENSDYLDYRSKYAQYIKDNESRIEVYSNLDIVNNAQETWLNQKWFEKQGLHPMPVWHFGSDPAWLKRYLDRGYDYIGIGGLVPNPYDVLKPALDDIFTKYLTDSQGYPRVKLHGFAATAIPLMTRYPWYSVDSSSWIKYGNYGWILLPQKIKGQWRYTEMCYKINCSGKSPTQEQAGRHYKTLSKQMRKLFDEYIEEMGFKMGKSRFEHVNGKLKEIIIEPGICNRPHLRSFLNACFYIGLTQQLPPWPWKFKAHKAQLFGGYK